MSGCLPQPIQEALLRFDSADCDCVKRAGLCGVVRSWGLLIWEHCLRAPVVDDRGGVAVGEAALENSVTLGDQSLVERADGRLPVRTAGIALGCSCFAGSGGDGRTSLWNRVE